MSKARGRGRNDRKIVYISTLVIHGIGPKASLFHRFPYSLHQETPAQSISQQRAIMNSQLSTLVGLSWNTFSCQFVTLASKASKINGLQWIIQILKEKKTVNEFRQCYEETKMPGTAVDLCNQNQRLERLLQKALLLWEQKRRKSVFKIQESESEEATCWCRNIGRELFGY